VDDIAQLRHTLYGVNALLAVWERRMPFPITLNFKAFPYWIYYDKTN
jgi:hypothetical protein